MILVEWGKWKVESMTQPLQSGIPQSPSAARAITASPAVLGCFTLVGFLVHFVVGVVLMVGGFVFFESQEAAHQATPTKAVDSYLDGMLYQHKTDVAESYTCGNGSIKRKTKSTVDGINKYIRKTGALMDYTWSSPAVKSRKGDRAIVTSQVSALVTVDNRMDDSPVTTWTFDVRDQFGWKVCGFSGT